MDTLSSTESSLFEGFRLDRRAGVLFRQDERGVFAPTTIGSRALDILGVLVERPGDLVSRAEIIEAVWPGTAVEDSNLNVQVAALRRILDQDRAQGSCIQTVPGRGYRFVASVTRVERAAILAADVAGYSRLMGEDEEGTHERLKGHLRELVEPKIAQHRGRIVKNTGDGFLAEFASVVDAVRCAVEVQRGMAERNAAAPPEKRIEFRVGINLGDVIAEGEDIFRDGVNVAARLEALAEPGGICISRTVREQIGDKLPYPLDDLGEQSVKNIARPVRVYALRPEAVADLPAANLPFAIPLRHIARVAIAAAVAAALLIAGGAWWLWPATKPSPPAVAATATIAHPLQAPRLSIVVLPFANLGGDPNQQYFADGITEDVTTDLSRIPDMLVISRNTAFTYQGKRVDTKQIGRELGVRFVLEGTVRRSGNQLRVNTQLIDAETDAHLWAERFDRDTGDLFALQDEITSRIAVTLNLELVRAEAARPTEHPDALDYILRGRAARMKPQSRDNFAETIGLFERALALDPRSVEAQSWLASWLAGRVLDGVTDSAAADIERAERLSGRALAASPSNPLAHFAKGQVLRAQRRPEEALLEYETAIAFDRNWVGALFGLSWCKLYIGSIEEVIPLLEQAIRLSPRDPSIWLWYYWTGNIHQLQGRTDEAILWMEKGRSINPAVPFPHASLASAYALKGQTERAAAELAEARRLRGEGSFPSITRIRANGYWGVPRVRALFEATFFEGLRKAGVPEE
jgi:adenylate cyclase